MPVDSPTYGAAWDDIRFPASRLRQGRTLKPDFDDDNVGLLFPQNDDGEVAYIIAQMPHDMLPGSNLHPHIHYVQDSASEPVFKLDYRWYENNGDPTGGFTTITASTLVFTYSAGSILQIAEWPAIDGSGISGVSSILDIKLYRDDNVLAGDCLVKEFDLHYQRGQRGSRSEYVY